MGRFPREVAEAERAGRPARAPTATGSNPSSHSTRGYTRKHGTYVQPNH